MKESVDLPERVGQTKVRERVRVRVRRPSRTRRRRRLRIPLLVAAILAALGALLVIPALRSGAGLEEARAEMERGRTALLAGDPEGAGDHFFRAEDAFLRARHDTENPLVRMAGYLPVVGRTPDAVNVMARAGAQTARSGRVLAEGMTELRGGPEALVPRDGTIPLSPLRRLQEPLARARDLIVTADRTMGQAPDRLLMGPVRGAREEFAGALGEARGAVVSTEAMVRVLPGFLGGGEPRRYFVGAQNPAELRGTGGLIGSYAILEVRQGRIDLGSFHPIQELPRAPTGTIEPPNPDFAARYGRYAASEHWSNINMTPDAPSAAVAIERLYREAVGRELDGVILVDPFALQGLLEATGEVEAPGIDRVLEAASVVDFVTNEAYAVYPDNRTRKRILGDAAEAVLDRFLDGRVDGGTAGAAAALIGAVADGHVVLHSTRPEEEEAFGEAGVAGALGGGAGDYLAVIGNNAAANKVDYYADRSVRYEVRLGAENTGTGRATVTLDNDAPTEGEPRYIIGPHDERFRPGENVTYLSTYCAPTCVLRDFAKEGRVEGPSHEVELGHQVFAVNARVPSGESGSFTYGWSIDRAWVGNSGSGVYRLTFHNQTTVRPTELVVDVRAPAGMTIRSASPDMEISGDRAVWRGEPSATVTFEVEFGRPLLSRAWHAVLDFLRSPAIRL